MFNLRIDKVKQICLKGVKNLLTSHFNFNILKSLTETNFLIEIVFKLLNLFHHYFNLTVMWKLASEIIRRPRLFCGSYQSLAQGQQANRMWTQAVKLNIKAKFSLNSIKPKDVPLMIWNRRKNVLRVLWTFL